MTALSPIKSNFSSKEEKPMKVYQIFLDGIDKTGKDLIRSYIYYLSKARYICVARGIMSMRVYAKLYDRPYAYDDECQKNVLNVLLEVDEEDWKIRCKTTNETLTDYAKEKKMFEEEANMLIKNHCNVILFNTSRNTPYDIAKNIVAFANKLNNDAKAMYILK